MSISSRDRVLYPLPKHGKARSRPEIDELRKWWNAGPKGVCTVLGVIGAGKTMLVQQFLQELRTPSLSDEVARDRPRFICSFERGLSAEHCCAGLFEWTARLRHEKLSETTMLNLNSLRWSLQNVPEPVLVVLDGADCALSSPPLDRRITDTSAPYGLLDNVLAEAVAGTFPQVAWLVTSHFPPQRARSIALESFDFGDLYEMDHDSYFLDGTSEFYWPIALDCLPIDSCVDLLRNGCGLQGSTRDLEALARRFDQHPQTLSLVGAYMKAFNCDNLAPATLTTLFGPPTEDVHLPRYLTEIRSHYLRRAERIRNVVERFRDQLKQRDPPSLALLERLSLFFLPPTAAAIERIFLGEDKGQVSGRYLKTLDADGLTERLNYLNDLDLVERRDLGNQSPQYSVHGGIKPLLPATVEHNQRKAVHAAIAKNMTEHTRRIELPDVAISRSILLPATATDRTSPKRTTYYWNEHTIGLSIASEYCNIDALLERIYHLINGGAMEDALHTLGELWESADPLYMWTPVITACEMFFDDAKPYNATLPKSLRPYHVAQLLLWWGSANLLLGKSHAAKLALDRALPLVQGRSDKPSVDMWRYIVSEQCKVLEYLGEATVLLDRTTKYLTTINKAGIAGQVARSGDKLNIDAFMRVEQVWALIRVGRVKEATTSRPQPGGFHYEFRMRQWLGLPVANSVQEYVRELGITPRSSCASPTTITFEDEWYINNHELPHIPQERCIAVAKQLLKESREKNYRFQECYAQVLLSEMYLGSIKKLSAILDEGLESDDASAWQKLRDIQSMLDESLQGGVNIARQCGYSMLHAQLLAVRARSLLLLVGDIGDIREARRTALMTLFGLHPVDVDEDPYLADTRLETDPPNGRGIFPSEESGLPRILAVTHPECGFFWGELEHRQILAEADLYEASTKLSANRFDPTKKHGGDIDRLIVSAKEQLEGLLKLHEEVDAQRPRGHCPDPDLGVVNELLAGIKAGRLPVVPSNRLMSPPIDLPDQLLELLGKAEKANVSRCHVLAYQSWLQVLALSCSPSDVWSELFQDQKRVPNALTDQPEEHKNELNTAWFAVRQLHRRKYPISYGVGDDVPDRDTWKRYVRHVRSVIRESSEI